MAAEEAGVRVKTFERKASIFTAAELPKDRCDALADSEKREQSSSTAKSVAVRAALFALSCYKSYLSVLFAGTCRYEPTCSRYAYEAIERFGVLRGVWLGIKRLLRCHPLSGRFGYDPVPESLEEMKMQSSRFPLKHKNNSLNANGERGTQQCEVRS